MKKATNSDISELFGYSRPNLSRWINVPERELRLEWLRVSATLIKNGITPKEALGFSDEMQKLKDRIETLENEKKNLEKELHSIADILEKMVKAQ